jgi:hypothetical protein
MGYHRIMGYGMQIPAYRRRRIARLWGVRGYGLFRLWVKRGPTVQHSKCAHTNTADRDFHHTTAI